MSAVYSAQQQRPRRRVALTVFLLPETLPDAVYPQFRARFLREASVLMRLWHPGLLSFYGYGEWEGLLYLITPYKTEESLATFIERQGPWSSTRILSLLEQVAAGLEYAHRQGQIHGMLTPAQVLCNSDGSFQIAGLGWQCLLERHGILPWRESWEHRHTLAGTPLCAPKYLAPEYRHGQGAQIRSDVYSLGVILVELHCGRFLADDLSTQEILHLLERQKEWSLPISLQRVVVHALAEDPHKRFQRVHDLLAAYAEQVDLEETREQKFQQPDPPMLLPLPSERKRPFQEGDVQRPGEEVLISASFAERWLVPPFPSSPPPLLRTKSNALPLQQRRGRSRRRVTALLAGGLVIGIAGAGGLSLARMLTAGKPGQTPSTANAIGQTTQALGSAQAFLDQRVADHRQRLLIHLPHGNFVAYKQGCTHVGVLVNYDPKTHLLVCPAHGAIFDPAQNGRVMREPTSSPPIAITPLPQVAIQISSTGMITLR
jgi:serine/threonine protein kinase/nitrite reductase/ring-hydroxylating ferredoxin subunit